MCVFPSGAYYLSGLSPRAPFPLQAAPSLWLERLPLLLVMLACLPTASSSAEQLQASQLHDPEVFVSVHLPSLPARKSFWRAETSFSPFSSYVAESPPMLTNG